MEKTNVALIDKPCDSSDPLYETVRNDGILEIDTSNLNSLVWPNREGERITNLQIDKEYNLTYPANASIKAFLLQGTHRGMFVGAKADSQGKVSKITLKPKKLVVEGQPTEWFVKPYKGDNWQEVAKEYSKFSEAPTRKCITNGERIFQVQVGLVDSSGKTRVPKERGYRVLEDIARVMHEEAGKGNILHIFGWQEGHDKDYPSYKPNDSLGGKEVLKESIRKVHDLGQIVDVYMNPRIASAHLVDKDPELQKAILRDENGRPFTETYHKNTFYVMDPCSEIWIKTLVQKGKEIAELGIDSTQLDQVAYQEVKGRKPGDEWGSGYIKLIKDMQDSLLIWTEGVSDIYPTNWQQMVNNWSKPKEIIISPDGG